MSERRIYVHGHSHEDRDVGEPAKMRTYIQRIFDDHDGRYLYGEGREGDTIVLSLGAVAYGHFNVGERQEPTPSDKLRYPEGETAYDVHSAVLYETPVPLKDILSTRTIRLKPSLSLEQFNRVRSQAGRLQTAYRPATSDADPFAAPMIFFRTTWMRFYDGEVVPASGGGSYVDENGYGHEMFNFRPYRGRVYGYVRPPTGGSKNVEFVDGAGIKIERIAGGTASDEGLDGVLVVWVAKHPEHGGLYIVGWYRNATVFCSAQPAPAGSERTHNGEDFGYYATADVDDARLLDIDERKFAVPRQEKGWMGQSNVWYADDQKAIGNFRRDVLRYVGTGELFAGKPKPAGTPKQLDPLLRAKVEQAAVETVRNFYERLHYVVVSRERDYVGWDLEAKNEKETLLLEVKGISGTDLCIELTPNEFAKMQEEKAKYRLCVVTDALESRKLAIFSYNPETNEWQDARRRILAVTPLTGARCSCG